MLTITLNPNLQTKLEQVAQSTGQPIDEIVGQALARHLEQWAEEQLEAEIKVFEQIHPRLKEQYLGQFVAIHQGQVVDADADLEPLYLRLQARFGDEPSLLVRQVSETPQEIYHFHGTRIG